ncbi:hypothetical protein ACZ87_03278 [Candidatus Erwinia dacicola]|uniref:Uncharacterized protein n=1 Tax=Candidatus Erwinia dacicola TaxID=252393 RepID=A0A328TH41_9GAMM|nr:hypothetical protein ACZ87_03278 [Candidatus Erwinia dacicola]
MPALLFGHRTRKQGKNRHSALAGFASAATEGKQNAKFFRQMATRF